MPTAPGEHLTIRAAEASDLESIAEIYVDSARYHHAIDPVVHQVPDLDGAHERIRAKLADPELEVYVAERDGVIVGFVEVKVVSMGQPGGIMRTIPSAEIGIAVRDGIRGGGIGTQLMRFAEDWGREHGCEAMVLDTAAANRGAIRLYQRLGYDVYGLQMRKPIGDPEC